MSLVLLTHLVVGTIVLISGTIALLAKKGSLPHRRAGTVFLISMLIEAANGMHLAALRTDMYLAIIMFTVIIAALAMYLVATSYMTVKRPEGTVGRFETGALAFALLCAAAGIYFGMDVATSSPGEKDLVPAEAYYFLTGLALLFALGDVILIMRRGISGKLRIARHLWRMCFAFLIALAILFVGNDQVFPEVLRTSGLLTVPLYALLAVMAFWLVRVLFTGWWRTDPHAETEV